MVLVMMGGEVSQRLVTLQEPVPQNVSATADRITRLYQGMKSDEIKTNMHLVSGWSATLSC